MTYRFEYDSERNIIGKNKNPLIGDHHQGSYNYFMTKSHLLGVSWFDYKPLKPIVIEEKVADSAVCTLSFCLGEGMEWSLKERPNKILGIASNESCVLTGGAVYSKSQFEKDKHYLGLGLSFKPKDLEGVYDYLEKNNLLTSYKELTLGLERFKTYAISPRVQGILSEVIHPNIDHSLNHLYLEGKFLELISVYLDETITEMSSIKSQVSLSKEDLEALREVKNILDKSFVQPYTLSQLSRMVYLNEYKLKTGFKQIYGQTVYSYVIDRRMALSKVLLEKQPYKVGEVAAKVGYANTGHFIKAFKKKYGVTPGVMARLCRSFNQ